MQVINLDAHRLKMLAPQPPLVLALGFFDGVHQGHQRVIQTAETGAKQRDLPLAVMTFNRHASQLFKSQTTFGIWIPSRKKTNMAALQVDRLYITVLTTNLLAWHRLRLKITLSGWMRKSLWRGLTIRSGRVAQMGCNSRNWAPVLWKRSRWIAWLIQQQSQFYGSGGWLLGADWTS